MKHPQATGRTDQRHPQTARPCGPTHYEGCACHEARRDATRDRLTMELDNLRKRVACMRSEAYRDGYAAGERMAAADVQILREKLTAQQAETLRAEQETERLHGAVRGLEEAILEKHEYEAWKLREQLTAQQRETLRAAQEAERYREALWAERLHGAVSGLEEVFVDEYGYDAWQLREMLTAQQRETIRTAQQLETLRAAQEAERYREQAEAFEQERAGWIAEQARELGRLTEAMMQRGLGSPGESSVDVALRHIEYLEAGESGAAAVRYRAALEEIVEDTYELHDAICIARRALEGEGE